MDKKEVHTTSGLVRTVQAVCHCGLVKISVPCAPPKVTSCNCSICHAYGHICAYYSEKDVTISGDTHIYSHGDMLIAFHRCVNCGCVTHWLGIDPTPESDRMAVNARLMPRDVLSAALVRHFDGFDTWGFRDEDKPFERKDISCNLMSAF